MKSAVWLATLGAAAVLACTGRIGGISAPLTGDGGIDAGADAGLDGSTPVDGGTDAGSDAGFDASVPDASSCPPPFSGTGSVVASGLSYPRHLAGSAARLYVTTVGVLNKPQGSVLAIDPADGGVTPLATGLSSPDAIAVDAANVYWVDEGGLERYPLPSGPAAPIDTKVNGALQGSSSIVLAGTEVLYATGSNFLELSKTNGSGNKTLFTGAPGSVVRAAAVDGTTGYFLYSGGPDAGLYQISLNGNSSAQQVLAAPLDGTDLVVTPTRFFWTTGGNGTGAVQSMVRPSGAIADVANHLAGPRAVLPLDGGFVFFQDSTAGSGATPWFFQVATPCLPGTPTTVGPVGEGPGDVLYDADAGVLFFTSYAGSGQGFIGRLP